MVPPSIPSANVQGHHERICSPEVVSFGRIPQYPNFSWNPYEPEAGSLPGRAGEHTSPTEIPGKGSVLSGYHLLPEG